VCYLKLLFTCDYLKHNVTYLTTVLMWAEVCLALYIARCAECRVLWDIEKRSFGQGMFYHRWIGDFILALTTLKIAT
jgi:hypothetical protein